MSLVHADHGSLTQHVPIDHAAILRAFNINVNDPKAQAMILACEKYGLDPLLKHAVLISGNLYITRDGLLHVAHRDGRLDGIVIEDEGDDAKEWWAKVTVYVKGQTHGYTYRGRYPKDGQQKKYGPEMAVKCAEVMALRRAFGVTGLPTVEEQWDIAPMVTREQMARIEELVPLVSDDDKAALSAWKEDERISMKSGEFTAEMADRVIAKLEELAQVEGGRSPARPEPERVTPEVVPPKSSGGERQSAAAALPPDVESVPGGEEGHTSARPDDLDSSQTPSVTPSGPVTLGDLLNRMDGKAAATRKGRLLHVATEVAREHTWPVPETIDDIDQRLLDAIADGLPLESRPLTDGQRKLMGAAWGKDEEGRKAAIDVASGFRGVTSTSDLTDAERDRFLTTCQEMLDEKGGR